MDLCPIGFHIQACSGYAVRAKDPEHFEIGSPRGVAAPGERHDFAEPEGAPEAEDGARDSDRPRASATR